MQTLSKITFPEKIELLKENLKSPQYFNIVEELVMILNPEKYQGESKYAYIYLDLDFYDSWNFARFIDRKNLFFRNKISLKRALQLCQILVKNIDGLDVLFDHSNIEFVDFDNSKYIKGDNLDLKWKKETEYVDLFISELPIDLYKKSDLINSEIIKLKLFSDFGLETYLFNSWNIDFDTKIISKDIFDMNKIDRLSLVNSLNNLEIGEFNFDKISKDHYSLSIKF